MSDMGQGAEMTIGIGSTVWVFDQDRRVYRKDATGRSVGGPIWREHWRPATIVGETSRSWVLTTPWGKAGKKVPKKGANPARYAFSKAEIDRSAWVVENRHRIASEVQRVNDHEKLRLIAGIVGYVDSGAKR